MLTKELTADQGAPQEYPAFPSKPHADWFRKRWEENISSVESLVSGRTSRVGSCSTEVGDGIVLVVDDEPAIAITLSQILIRHGFPSVWLTDPRRAAFLLHKLPVRLLITDIDMPGIDGVTLATIARHGGLNCPILLFSARGPECEAAQRLCLSASGTHVQTKPVSATFLLNLVRRLCAST